MSPTRKHLAFDVPVLLPGQRLTYVQQVVELAKIYAQLPEVACKGHCYGTCQNIPAQPIEVARIRQRTGIQLAPTGPCPALKDQRCSVYPYRPAICRLYGASNDLRLTCRWGCGPEEQLTTADAFLIIAAVQYIEGRLSLPEYEQLMTGIKNGNVPLELSSCALPLSP